MTDDPRDLQWVPAADNAHGPRDDCWRREVVVKEPQ